MKKTALLSLSLVVAISASAGNIEFTYNATGAEPEGYGYKKDQTYDVGIALSSSELKGKKIVGFEVPVYSLEYVGSPKAWLSKALSATVGTETTFTPDVASYDATIENGILFFTFPEPYQIPEEGIYLGYSLSINGLPSSETAQPIAVTPGSTPGGLWLHASSSQTKWSDLSSRKELLSAMTVRLEGDFASNAATIGSKTQRIYAAKEGIAMMKASLENWGEQGISSFDYVYTVGDIEKSGSYQFEETVPAILGRKATAEIEIMAPAALGDYEVGIKVTKVNGVANETEQAPFTVPMTVQPFVATYRPLVEEYTGLRCGYCPRGYVMLEQMKLKYGDLFVAMAYHGTMEGDEMTYISPSDFPLSFTGYPASAFNRGTNMDPGNIPNIWELNRDVNPSAEIAVDLEWADAEQTKLVAKSKTRFISDIADSPYVLSFALVADGMGKPYWLQSNGYADYEPTGIYAGPYWDLFVGKGSPVAGLTFNDVVVYYPDVKGIKESLPQNIEADKWYEYTFEVETENVRTLQGTDYISDFNKTRVIGIVLNGKTGKPINCISSIYPDGKSPEVDTVEGIGADEAEVVGVEVYDLQGRRISEPDAGLNIIREKLSDGSFRTKKVIGL